MRTMPSRGPNTKTTSITAQSLLLVAALLLPLAASSSVSCPFCIFGRLQSGTCTCACDSPYLPPTCGYKATDQVVVDFFMNASIDGFNSALFLEGLSLAASNESVSMLYARNLSHFNASTVRTTMPGYAVRRVLDSIAYNDTWITENAIISAYPQTAIAATNKWVYDYVLYQSSSGQIVISVAGVAWVVAAALLAICCGACEHCFLSNTEDGHYNMEFNFSDVQAKKKEARRKEREMAHRAPMQGNGDGGVDQEPPAV